MLFSPCAEEHSVNKRLVNIFEKVDFPEDFGPQTRVIIGVVFEAVVTSEASFLFHSGRDTSSWMMLLLGASSEVHSCDTIRRLTLNTLLHSQSGK